MPRGGMSHASDEEDSIEAISEQAGDSFDFMSEQITTEQDDKESDKDEVVWVEPDINDKPTLHKYFHTSLQRHESIVVQPKGKSLERSLHLDQPVFFLRDIPIKEQYKKALKKINAVTCPEKNREKEKPE